MAGIFRAEVRIELKEGVSDPEGAWTHKTLEVLGYKSVRGVRSRKVFTLEIEAPSIGDAEKVAWEVARGFLSNPVIHDTHVFVESAR